MHRHLEFINLNYLPNGNFDKLSRTFAITRKVSYRFENAIFADDSADRPYR
jgi:hypothetical protein